MSIPMSTAKLAHARRMLNHLVKQQKAPCTLPLRVLIDSAPLSTEVAREDGSGTGRPIVTFAIDMATKRVIGFDIQFEDAGPVSPVGARNGREEN